MFACRVKGCNRERQVDMNALPTVEEEESSTAPQQGIFEKSISLCCTSSFHYARRLGCLHKLKGHVTTGGWK